MCLRRWKEIQKIWIQTLQSFHLRQSCLTYELWGCIYRETSTGRSHTSSSTPLLKTPVSVKRRPRCMTPGQPNWHHHSPTFARRMEWILRKPSDSEAVLSNQIEAVRCARRWWYHIPSEVFWGRDSNSRKSVSSAHSCNELLLLPGAHHKKRGSKPQDVACLLKTEWTENQIARLSCIKNPTFHPWWQQSIMTTNASWQVLHGY